MMIDNNNNNKQINCRKETEMYDKHWKVQTSQQNSELLIKFKVRWAAAPLRELGQEEGVFWEAAGEYWGRERERERRVGNEHHKVRLTLQQHMVEEVLEVRGEMMFHWNALQFH